MPNQAKVLLVDDSADDCCLLLNALEKFPCLQVVAALEDDIETLFYLNGAGAYADRSRFPYPDVVLLDLQMPALNGFQVLQSIRAEGRSHPRVVIISDSNESAALEEAHRLGASLYLVKNGRFSELARRIAEFLSDPPVEIARG